MLSPEELIERDKACVWHPFTQMRAWLAGQDDRGRVIVAADGFELIDARGRRYIDGFSSLWCNLHGHRVPKIDAAIRAQLDRVAHSTLLGHASDPSIELAGRLVKIAPPGLTKVFYSDCGASAVEVAVKMAFQYWRNLGQPERKKFLALRQSYHGDTLGSVSVGGIDAFHGIFAPLLFDVTFADTPNEYYHPAGSQAGHAVLHQIDVLLDESPGEYCAVIVEPMVQAAAGMLTHPAGFLAGLAEVSLRHDVLLIVDEVATGFCRTGKMFACEHEGVRPDLMCLGKGITGGYLPVSATLATQKVFDAFLGEHGEGRTFYHGHTFAGNALGCAAGVASIDLIFESHLLESLPGRVQQMSAALATLANHPHVGDIRQCGMMAGVELVRGRKGPRRFEPELGVGSAVCRRALEHGVIIRPLGDVVVLMPAPAMDERTLGRMLEATIASINEYFADNPTI